MEGNVWAYALDDRGRRLRAADILHQLLWRLAMERTIIALLLLAGSACADFCPLPWMGVFPASSQIGDNSPVEFIGLNDELSLIHI